MHTQHKETGRQAGSGGEETREKAAYACKAVGGGAQGVCRGHCRGARDGSALIEEQRDPSKKIRTPAEMWSPSLASQAEAREFPLSSWVAGEAADSQT